MKKIIFVLFCLAAQFTFAQFNYQRAWATYFQGANALLTDSKLDHDGNIVLLGKLQLKLPVNNYVAFTTPNTYQPDLLSTTQEASFLVKISAGGNLIWGTYLFQKNTTTNASGANPGYSSIAIDSQDNIYVTGSSDFSTDIGTPNVFMETQQTETNGATTITSSGYLLKFNNLGNKVWGTFLPGDPFKVAIDNNDFLFVIGATAFLNNVATPGVYQENLLPTLPITGSTSNLNYFVEKIDNNANRIAGTYLGVVSTNYTSDKIAIDSENNLIVGINLDQSGNSTLTTPNCYQPMMQGGKEIVLMKISNDLTTKFWGTYYGGYYDDRLTSITTYGKEIYISATSRSIGLGTPNVFRPSKIYSDTAGIIAKFDEFGNREWCTYDDYTMSPIDLTATADKLYCLGLAFYYNPTSGATVSAYQLNYGGGICDNFFQSFNKNGTRNWSSFYGGEDTEAGNKKILVNNDSFYLVSGTQSLTNIATAGSFQSQLLYDVNAPSNSNHFNIFIAKFEYLPLITTNFEKTSFSLSPNPNHGSFSLNGDFQEFNNANITLYDNLGRAIVSKQITSNRTIIDFSEVLSSGIYFAKLSNDNLVLQTFKVVVE